MDKPVEKKILMNKLMKKLFPHTAYEIKYWEEKYEYEQKRLKWAEDDKEELKKEIKELRELRSVLKLPECSSDFCNHCKNAVRHKPHSGKEIIVGCKLEAPCANFEEVEIK